ncbi:MAG: RIO1 family regulatory kinase/ATPase [Candidatus Freyrarchaeum guaymaensis]
MEKTIIKFKQLESEDFRVLSIVEKGMRRYEYVPVDYIVKRYKHGLEGTTDRLDRLHKLNLLVRWTGSYVGYKLTVQGYDSLALGSLVYSDVIGAFGREVGLGKESDVYDALTPSGDRIVVKLHRLGRTSFRQIRRLRSYLGDRGRVSWFYTSRLSAEREFEALKILYEAGVSVPRPRGHNRHAVVMDFVEGDELYLVRELPDPSSVLREILDNVRRAYSADVVHSDLSEHNVILTPDLHVVLIDWPQWVRVGHADALRYLRRDVYNVLRFFERRFGVKEDLESVLEKITASS